MSDPNVRSAIREAVSALYDGDMHDPVEALEDILLHLDPEVAEQFRDDPATVYNAVNDELYTAGEQPQPELAVVAVCFIFGILCVILAAIFNGVQ